MVGCGGGRACIVVVVVVGGGAGQNKGWFGNATPVGSRLAAVSTNTQTKKKRR